MRKAAVFYLFVFLLLFLSGCAGSGESAGSSENGESVFSLPDETVSSQSEDRQDSQPEKPQDTAHLTIEGGESDVYRFIVSGYGPDDIDYGTYFSQERYIEHLSQMGIGGLEWGNNNCSVFVRTLEGPVEIYRNRLPMDDVYLFDRTVLYFVRDKALYRLFIHSGQLDQIFTSDREFSFYPITNYRTMILYPNPDFTKTMAEYGADYLPADHPNESTGYLYNSQTQESLPFSPVDLGYEENMNMTLIPREEIVPLN